MRILFNGQPCSSVAAEHDHLILERDQSALRFPLGVIFKAKLALEGVAVTRIKIAGHQFRFLQLEADDQAGRQAILSLYQQIAMRRLTNPEGDEVIKANYERLLLSPEWRLSHLNQDFGLCESYGTSLVVPASIGDSCLKHAAPFRARHRLPILAYRHPHNGATICRSSQPLVGLWAKRRSIQDERLVEAIRLANPHNRDRLLITDARPGLNAVVSAMAGAGFEPLDHYAGCERIFINIDNIHTIRDCYLELMRRVKKGVDPSVAFADWNGHLRIIWEGVGKIVGQIVAGCSVLVHCSDGWDRTAQLTSLCAICLDPHYRTMAGLRELVEREWLEAGHQFALRLGHGLPLNRLKLSGTGLVMNWLQNDQECSEFCPIFPQFLHALRSLVASQNSQSFEYTEEALALLADEAFNRNTRLFTGNCAKDRRLCLADWQAFWEALPRNTQYEPSDEIFHNCTVTPWLTLLNN